MTSSELRTLGAGRVRARWLALPGASVGRTSVVGARLMAPRASGTAIAARAILEHDVYINLMITEAKLALGEFGCNRVGAHHRQDVAPQTIVAGAPARLLRMRSADE